MRTAHPSTRASADTRAPVQSLLFAAFPRIVAKDIARQIRKDRLLGGFSRPVGDARQEGSTGTGGEVRCFRLQWSRAATSGRTPEILSQVRLERLVRPCPET